MASSIKALLWNKPNKDGLYPIVIRIIKNRKPRYLYIGHYIEKKYWNTVDRKVKKSHPNSVRLNNLISSKLAEANNVLIDLQSNDKDISSKQIKNEISKSSSSKTFGALSQEYLIELKENNKLSRYSSDKVRINHLIEFAGTRNIEFREIDDNFLRKFMSFLKIKKGNGQRSIVNSLVVVRTIYNRAIRQDSVDSKYYPFGKDKIQIKFPEAKKIGLTIQEVQSLESMDDLTAMEMHTRNVWLFSFYLAGMRISDVLKIQWDNIYDGRLHYRMDKNDKLLSLILPDKLLPILEQYKDDKKNDRDFVFPEMKKADLKNPQDIFAKTKTATKKFNKYLGNIAKKIKLEKKLTMHIARHSFGNIAGDKIPIQMLQKLYRHSSITTTINYQSNFMHKEVDEALEKVITF